MNNMPKFTNFQSYVLRRLEENYIQFYNSHEEYVEHLLEGEVTVPITFMIQLQKEFEDQLPCGCEDVSEEEVLKQLHAAFVERHF